MDSLKPDRNESPKGLSSDLSAAPPESVPIPVYTIDLSLPPDQRYVKVATDFAPKMRSLIHLFDEILSSITPHPFTKRVIEFFASIFLFRLFSAEETKELRGISKACGVKMFLLVALNVLLDSMLGCTSGGVLVAPKKVKGQEEEEPRMMHLRTLDWGMDPLREVLVVLEFVKSASEEPEKVLVRTVTYAGFVGVLTGVKKDLSLSLNFRGVHECTTRQLRLHQLLVLFGFRPSIASILRNIIMPSTSTSTSTSTSAPVSQVAKDLENVKCSPCYLMLSSGDQTYMLEKDLYHARTSHSDEFIVVTNCDCVTEPDAEAEKKPAAVAAAMESVIVWADERKDILVERFNGVKKRQEKKWREQNADGMKWREDNASGMEGFKVKVLESTMMGWMKVYPIWSELTHFGCVMDPKKGEIRWIERGVLEDGVELSEDEEVGEDGGDSMGVNVGR